MAGRLCCAVLCLLGVGPTDAGVTPTPRDKLTKMGQEVTLSCKPISSHCYLYWCRQTSVQGPESLIYFHIQAPIDDQGAPNTRFSAEMPNESFSTLKIQATDPEDSATFLCASSLATALQSHPLPVQKPSGFPFPLQPQPS
ncbi:T-cell receptor beta chain V region YT35 [Pteropus alecto]|nr:T-cell receptor beta chain V region YT35 [Pteropus alecto]